MPQVVWSISAPPRYDIGSFIAGRYSVKRVLKEGKAFQLLHVRDREGGVPKVVRVINRSRIADEDVLQEVDWLKDTRVSGERLSEFSEESRDILYFYLAFHAGCKTLKDILADKDLHISRRHAREISHQLVRAVHFLHVDRITHTDLAPENIEIVYGDTVNELWRNQNGLFLTRKVLICTQIKLSFYGRVGQKGTTNMGTDQYRSPEIVYDMRIREISDVFSIGCIIYEIVTKTPLFPSCQEGPLYRREKTIAYDAVLGPFPDKLIRDIRRSYPGIFKYSNSDFPERDSKISLVIREFADTAFPIRGLIIDEDALDIIECTVKLDYRMRVPLGNLTTHPFFHNED